jgi:hypothetical protein
MHHGSAYCDHLRFSLTVCGLMIEANARVLSFPKVISGRNGGVDLSLLKFNRAWEAGDFHEPAVLSLSWSQFSLPLYRYLFSVSAAAPRSNSSLSLFSISWPFYADNARSSSAFIPGSASMGVALSDLAPGHRRDGAGQAGNRRRVASQGLPVLLAMAITWSGTAQD